MSINTPRRIYPIEAKQDLKTLLEWVKRQPEQIVYDLQEVIFNFIRVLTDNSFRKTIVVQRRQYQVPQDFLSMPREESNKYEDWLNNHSDQVPVDPWDKRIAEVCQKHQLSPDKYGEFVLNYLYFGEVTPVGELVTLENDLSIDEPKYKARISIHKDKDDLPEGVYIRLYQDTTKNQLHEYIDKNWQIITFLQQFLAPFPSTRNRKAWLFKRDLVIFLNHSLGRNAPKIIDQIMSDFITDENYDKDEKKYNLNDSNIRKIVSDFYKDIQNSSDI